MKTLIRPATAFDAEAICTVVRRSIAECCGPDHHNDPARLAAWLNNKTVPNTLAWLQGSHAYAVVAEADGAVGGFAMSRGDEVLLCYVTPEVLHRGVGKSLLQALEAHAEHNGVASLRLDSTRTALPFYGRNGFRATGPVCVFFGLEAQPMAKTLRPQNSAPPIPIPA